MMETVLLLPAFYQSKSQKKKAKNVASINQNAEEVDAEALGYIVIWDTL